MKRISLASALGVGVLVALAVPASAGAAQAPTNSFHDIAYTGLHQVQLDPDKVYADIQILFTWDITDDDDDPLSASTGIAEVGDGVEMPSQDVVWPIYDGFSCASPSVDISLDLSTVTVTGHDPGTDCPMQAAHLVITLYNGEFGAVTLGQDLLFTPYVPPQINSNVLGSVVFSDLATVSPPVDVPTVQDPLTTGATFVADWLGNGQGIMNGVTQFQFAVDADGAQPVPGDPTFTG